jgi:hypothetical protein
MEMEWLLSVSCKYIFLLGSKISILTFRFGFYSPLGSKTMMPNINL